MLSLVEVGRVVLEMNVVNVFFINFYYLPLVEDKAKFESFYSGVVCDKFGWNWHPERMKNVKRLQTAESTTIEQKSSPGLKRIIIRTDINPVQKVK